MTNRTICSLEPLFEEAKRAISTSLDSEIEIIQKNII